jgi:hypothetical protein
MKNLGIQQCVMQQVTWMQNSLVFWLITMGLEEKKIIRFSVNKEFSSFYPDWWF